MNILVLGYSSLNYKQQNGILKSKYKLYNIKSHNICSTNTYIIEEDLLK